MTAWSADAPCRLCPRECGAVRSQSPGLCGAGALPRVALAQLHHWEEPVLSGPSPEFGGSGTIFFSGCSLRCVYCQNHHISMPGQGQEPGQDVSVDDLTALMLQLQLSGAHNVNLVTPSHFTPQVRQAIIQAKAHGLSVPVVWNSSAYESVEALRSLEGLVDIYLADLRYMDKGAAGRFSAAPDYPSIATHAIYEMHRQVGQLVLDETPAGLGLARRGVLVRLLALPENMGRADLALSWIADTLGTDTVVSLMGQYYPAHRAHEFPELARAVTPGEYATLRRHMDELGFERFFAQEVGSSAAFTPDFRPK